MHISARDKLLQFNYPHRIYYTPQRLRKMGRLDSPACYRCRGAVGDFFHMLWQCPIIVNFWKAILQYLEEALALPNIYSPARCLLGDLEEESISTSQKTLFRILFCYAKKAIALRWREPTPPSLQNWIDLVNNSLPMYKLKYAARGSTKKFDIVWAGWLKYTSGDGMKD